jgi:predicted NAD-dependent protein-ADP-ribosyltransferase YbiA (DUF1768 family)
MLRFHRRLGRLLLAGAFALPLLAGCEVNSTKDTQTADGKHQVEHNTTDINVDPALQARARQAGQDIKEAGRKVSQEAKEGWNDVKRNVPDVNVNVREKHDANNPR